ncbi:NAD(P)-dependent oxidoreductase [Rhodoferax sp. TH121]|uniref:SDR family oxidoreductase n=1 Tax=Rhodoferax sp. TH121 TaxID=2022803 RepID=UPI000B9729F6|nr:SDR family oxidoreductase [Rhodoferax sp. TH121]OYQ42200.1 NAD(P)-dependent oxidoreductase [Rhodoferax sp. TH121]
MTTLLVTGASGKFGLRVLHHLLETLQIAPERIIATTRKPATLSAFAQRGVRVRAADFDEPASLPLAFAGADRLLIISTDAIGQPGRRLEQHERAIAAAEQAGVQHLLYTSCPEPEGSPLHIAPDHEGTEQAIRGSKFTGWTLLRNHWYFDNLMFSLPGIAAQGGKWFTAAGEGRVASLSRDDLAYAAAVALASPGETGKTTYTLSGDEALSTAEQAAILARELGKAIEVVQVPVEAIVQGMVGAGFPEPVATALASFDTNTAAGRVATVTADFRRLTNRPPRRLADWVKTNRSMLLGN